MAGILDMYGDPDTQGLLALSAGLLQAGGYNPFPVGIGQALGGGVMQSMAAHNAARSQLAAQQQLALHSMLYGAQARKALAEAQRQERFNAAWDKEEADATPVPAPTATGGVLAQSAAPSMVRTGGPGQGLLAYAPPEQAAAPTPVGNMGPFAGDAERLRRRGAKLARLGDSAEGKALIEAGNALDNENFEFKPVGGANGLPIMAWVGNKGTIRPAPGYSPTSTIPEGFTAGPNGLVLDPAYKGYKLDLARASQSQVNVNNAVPFNEALQGEMARKLVGDYERMQNVPSQIRTIDLAIDAARKAGPFAGSLAEQKLEAAKFLNNNLGTRIAPEAVQSAEVFRSAAFRQVMDNLKQMDSQPSERQQTALQNAMGRLDTDPSALPDVLQITRDILASRAENHNKRVRETQQGPNPIRFPYSISIDVPQQATGDRGVPTYDPMTGTLVYPNKRK